MTGIHRGAEWNGWVGWVGRRRPPQTSGVGLGVGQHTEPFADGERGEGVYALGRDRSSELGPAHIFGGTHVEQLRVVGTGHSQVQPVGIAGRSSGGINVVEADVLGIEPKQWRRIVVLEERPGGGIELPIGVEVVAGVIDQVHQRGHVDGDPMGACIGPHRLPADRSRPEPSGQLADPDPGRAGRSAERAAADGVEAAAGGAHARGVPGVQVAGLIGRVRYDRSQQLRISGEERLGEERAVGVAVQVDAGETKCGQHPGQVASLVDRGEQIGGVYVSSAATEGVVELPPAGIGGRWGLCWPR